MRFTLWITLLTLLLSGCGEEKKKTDDKAEEESTKEESVRLSKAGESCANTIDCEEPLGCISQVCTPLLIHCGSKI